MSSSKRILLINSSVMSSDCKSVMVGNLGEEPYPPLGLLYIASTLMERGIKVELLDIPVVFLKKRIEARNQQIPNWDFNEMILKQIVKERVQDFQADLVGISCLFSGKFRGTVLISEAVKEARPQCPVVIGGLHPTVFAQEALERLPSVDFVILGEGEQSFGDLLSSLFENRMPLSDIDGLAYRDSNGTTHVNQKTSFINELDRLPLPAWGIIDLDDYAIEDEAWQSFWENPKRYPLRYRMPLLTSRSCPMQCRFCAMHLVHGKGIRFRSVENCLKELEWLHYDFGVNYFSIIDDNFTLNKNRVIDFANEIVKRNIKIYLDAPSGISMHFYDKEIHDALMAVGMLRLFFPIESGSDYMREHVMGKKLSREKIYENSEIVRNEKDLFVRAFFVIGMPQETEETLRASWDMMEELYIDDVSIHFATPFPGTALYEEVIQNNLLDIPLRDVFFADDFQQSSDRPFIKPYHLEIDDLIKFKNRVEGLFLKRREKYGVKKNRSMKHLY